MEYQESVGGMLTSDAKNCIIKTLSSTCMLNPGER